MQVKYKGISKDFDYRVAEIYYTDNEQNILDRMCLGMSKTTNYRIDIVTDGYAICEVDDMNDFKDFCRLFKKWKKMINQCEKRGF